MRSANEARASLSMIGRLAWREGVRCDATAIRVGHDTFSRTRYINLETSPKETHQSPHKPSPRRSEYAGDSIGDFFVKAPTGFERLLELNAVRGQAIDHVLPARSPPVLILTWTGRPRRFKALCTASFSGIGARPPI